MIKRVLIFLEGIVYKHFLALGTSFVNLRSLSEISTGKVVGCDLQVQIKIAIENSFLSKLPYETIRGRETSDTRLKSYPWGSEISLSCTPPVLNSIYPAHSHYSLKSVRIFKNTCSWLNYPSAFYLSIVHQRCEYMLQVGQNIIIVLYA